ncbi:lipocalin family protein [Staphylococcus shinii]|uniref:lipocalin family protein n=1 Tax=Staphylococcus shinii TaxID=2912228 RepID=UPI003F5707D6
MKKIKYLLPMLLMTIVMLSACGKSDVEGKWEVPSAIDLGTHGNYYEFNKDGTYSHDKGDSIGSEEGKYEVEGNTIKITAKNAAIDGSKTFKYKLKMSDDKKSFKHEGEKFKKDTEKEKQ